MKNILIAFVLSLLTFYTVDLIHEKFSSKEGQPFSRYVASSHYTPHPYISFKDGGYSLGANQGYFGPIPSKKKDNTFRIFILGGSAVVNSNAPFPVYLEKKLKKDGHGNIRVYNFGVVSSGIGQDISRIIHELVNYHPDLIIFYNGYNEFYHPWNADPRPGYPFNFIVEEGNPLRIVIPSEYPLFGLILYRSSLLRTMFPDFFLEKFTKREKIRERIDHGSEKWIKEIATSYWSYIQKAKKLGKAFNFKVLVVFQALRDESAYEDSFKYLYDLAFESTYFFDRRNLFSNFNKKDVFTDSVHIKSEYEPYVANEIAKILLKNKRFLVKKQQ